MSLVRFTREIFDRGSGEPIPSLIAEMEKVFSPGDTIAIKLHMGEERNNTSLSPILARSIAKAIMEVGAKPFLFDSPVAYNSRRHTPEGYKELALARGFTPDYIGCPVVISNEAIPLEGSKATYGFCKVLSDVDGTCILTHVKGHMCTGFGGAIKNIGMGAMSRETKTLIHDGGKPVYRGGCTECMKCVEMCPTGNVRLAEGRPEFDVSYCTGCSNCSFVCEAGAITPAVDYFDMLLAEAVKLALPRMGRLLFINSMINITSLCDCAPDSGRILCEDLGHLVSRDICAIEKASFDMIRERKGRDVFMDEHHVSPAGHLERLRSLMGAPGEYTLQGEEV